MKLSESSPFAVALTEDGSYRYEIHIGVERAKSPKEGDFVAWVTTPELDRVERVGTLDQDMAGTLRVTGAVEWNKFIVVISLELTDDPAQERWSGPVAFRGMSRSGAMHTMVGHGALQQENCAAWGY